jgi:hypothetical protein
MNNNYTVKNPPADYEMILPRYYDVMKNAHQPGIDDGHELLVKEMTYDSLLTETGKNFPLIRGLENNELWFELITNVLDKHVDTSQNDVNPEWNGTISDIVNKTKLNSNITRFKAAKIGYLAAALILLSVISVSLLIKTESDKNRIPGKTSVVSRDVNNRITDVEIDTEKRTIENLRKCNIINLDSGSRAIVDSGAIVSDIQIADKRVSLNVLRGAVAFSVAKKRTREFIVNAGVADIVVTGTKFRVIRMDSVVTVAVNNGSVKTMYKSGAGEVILTDGQVAIVMKETILVIKHDSLPDIPERKLLRNLLDKDDVGEYGYELISKRTADSLLDILFTSGMTYPAEGDLIEHFSLILESKGRYKDALTVLQHHPEFSNNGAVYNSLTKMKSTLLLKNGDTNTAVRYIENVLGDSKKQEDRCNALSKLYTIFQKSHNLLKADTCLHHLVECTYKNNGLDKIIIDHAHQLRNASKPELALFWYEYVLENFIESNYRKDAEYWISDCVIKKSMEKNSALYNKSTSSGH